MFEFIRSQNGKVPRQLNDLSNFPQAVNNRTRIQIVFFFD